MSRIAIIAVLTLAGCAHGGASSGEVLTLRAACSDAQRWDGKACVDRGGGDDLAAGVTALVDFKPDVAEASLDKASTHLLDWASNVTLWEQRGILQAYLDRGDAARAAFNVVLDYDPDHKLNYWLSPKATFPFQQARVDAAARGIPSFELTWSRDLRLGGPVAVSLTTLRDPRGMLARTTLYVRRRGETEWQAADIDLPDVGKKRRVLLPEVSGKKTISLEMYAVASDDAGNEVLTWASPARPRELILRPPIPWYRKWWVWAAAGGLVAVGTGVTVYATVWEPSAEIDGGIHLP